jgi:hypothetical protein
MTLSSVEIQVGLGGVLWIVVMGMYRLCFSFLSHQRRNLPDGSPNGSTIDALLFVARAAKWSIQPFAAITLGYVTLPFAEFIEMYISPDYLTATGLASSSVLLSVLVSWSSRFEINLDPITKSS